MRNEDNEFTKIIAARLREFDRKVHPLPGIDDEDARGSFVFQLVESIRRIRFVQQIAERPIANSRRDPSSEFFDPVRAAVLYRRAGDIDEACWLVFLFVHFGKNAKSGYRLIADVYGRLGLGVAWTWQQILRDPIAFRHWLANNQRNLRTDATTHRGFGNHRKYQSLDAWKPSGTGDAVQSYISWVEACGGHVNLFTNALSVANGDAEGAFAYLYEEMNAVRSFGRTARFDYLAMIGKLRLAPIRPDSVHFDGATGPVTGARLLFSGQLKGKNPARDMEELADSLASFLQVDKQVVEDSLCNWQKNPTAPVRFRG